MRAEVSIGALRALRKRESDEDTIRNFITKGQDSCANWQGGSEAGPPSPGRSDLPVAACIEWLKLMVQRPATGPANE